MNKLILVLLYICFSCTLSAQAVSYKNTSLLTILQDLEEKYGYSYALSQSSLLDITVSGDIPLKDFEPSLSKMLQSAGMEYKIIDRTILIREVSATLHATPHLTIQGIITNESTPLSYASIYVENTTLGTYSHDDGSFSLELPIEHQDKNLVISYIGFEDHLLKIKEMDNELILVKMKESPLSIGEIIISNTKKKISILNNDGYERLLMDTSPMGAAAFGDRDVSRQISLMAGISGHDDTSADIKIRGSNSDQTLMLLDNMPIYNASHYFGVFSALNPLYIHEANLYRNNLPVQYGGRASGMVELHGHNAAKKNIDALGEINLLTSSLMLKTPVWNGLSAVAAFRTALRNISNSQYNTFTPKRRPIRMLENNDEERLPLSDPSLFFNDANAKLTYRYGKKNSLSLNMYRSSDNLTNEISTTINSPSEANRNLQQSDNDRWISEATSFSSKLAISDGILNTSMHHSQYNQKGDFSLDYTGPNRQENIQLKEREKVSDTGIKTFYTFPINSDSISLGIDVNRYLTAYHLIENDTSILSGNDASFLSSAFGNYNYQSSLLTLNLGMRYTYHRLSRDHFISPRLSANYFISNHVQLKSALGYYRQYIRQLNFDYHGENKYIWLTANTTIPSITSLKSMVGASVILDHVTFDMEIYYKSITGIVALSALTPGRAIASNQGYTLLNGKRRTYGMDLTISHQQQNMLSYLTYTLSSSEDAFADIARGKYLPSENDRRHQLKWVNQYTLGNIKVGLDAVYASGRPYLDLSTLGKKDIRNGIKPFKRIPNYLRIDAGLGYSFNVKNSTCTLGVSLMNVLNRKNVGYVQNVLSLDRNNSTKSVVVGAENSMLARTINISAQFGF